MIDQVVAKMQCHVNQAQKGVFDGMHTVALGAVYAGYEKDKENGENAVFGKWTPSGEVRMAICNPEANAFFKEGKKYYVTFTEAPD